jgi:hypothetical protein
MPLLETKGAASAQGFGEFAKVGAANYIEDVFNTWLFNAGASFLDQVSVNNGVDYTKGAALTITKTRSVSGVPAWVDTVRGQDYSLWSSSTSAQNYQATGVINGLTSSGFTWLTGSGQGGATVASWTFRKQPKFFDVVTYTGASPSSVTVNHNLGSVPGCIIIKCINDAASWAVYHRSTGIGQILYLNGTQAASSDTTFVTAVTSTSFTVGDNAFTNNSPSKTYVAYLFAHDAGGFGLTGTDNVISCGSYTGTGAAGNAITLGYEPQWLLIKRTDSTSDWAMFNNMMGMTLTDDTYLWANLGSVENTYNVLAPTATGFVFQDPYLNASGGTYIYIAIRRGPMKTPTTGTSVYEGTTRNGTGAAASISGLAFPPDAVLTRNRDSNSSSRYAWYDKLRGATRYLDTAATDAEFTVAQSLTSFNQTGESFGTGVISNANGEPYINWQFRRAPGFFDVVCYTGTGAVQNLTHNLGVVPEMMIGKSRSGTFDWCVYHKDVGNTKATYLNGTGTPVTSLDFWNDTTPTASVFTIGTINRLNTNGNTQVMYLFATCAGVSKVGSYTGTGTTLQIDCGFTGGARFVLIKRTDSTGDWYVWDSARGIVSGNDPYLLLNTSGAEVQGTDYVDTYSAGFEISSTAPAAINANGGTYLFLAIA